MAENPLYLFFCFSFGIALRVLYLPAKSGVHLNLKFIKIILGKMIN